MDLGPLLLQQFVNGVSLGSVYVLLAVGFTLSMGVLKLLNVAHGHFYMLGAYLVFSFAHLAGLGYWPAVILTIPSMFLVGVIVHFAGIRPLHGKGFLAPILSTLAIAFLMESIALLIWPGTVRLIDTPHNYVTYTLAGASFTEQRLLTFIAAMVLTGALYFFLQRTKPGRALRATTQNEDSAELVGINGGAMRLFALGLSAALAGAAGGLIGPLFAVYPAMGLSALFKALIVVLLGGLGSILGAVLGGLLLGLFEAFFGGSVSASWTPVAMFAMIIIILIVRPRGLFGREELE
jgi:branched-subunit amino acid ABC-type transport system permease component